jgi:hypothetical protein
MGVCEVGLVGKLVIEQRSSGGESDGLENVFSSDLRLGIVLLCEIDLLSELNFKLLKRDLFEVLKKLLSSN